jgi:hypothetical protein
MEKGLTNENIRGNIEKEAKMAENYMKQYIELSKKFKEDNKSQELIGKLYEFMNILEKDDHNENKMVLTYVYTLMGFHKKAYDLYVKIYNENDRKQKAKLFDMEQMSKSHGDNFIVKLKKKQIPNRKIEFTVNDFIKKEQIGEWLNYILNGKCIIFGQILDNKLLKIKIHKNMELSQYISKINEYLQWLGWNCKNTLIKYYNENMAEWTEETANNDWYEEMEIYSVSIIINKDNGNIFAEISCGDNIAEDHILDIEFTGEKINSMNYDG